MTKVEELIQKVRDGKVAILNDGTLDQLREILGLCFPDENDEAGGCHKYYESHKANKKHWWSDDTTSLPTVSVKEFYEDELREEYPIGVIVEDTNSGNVMAKVPSTKFFKNLMVIITHTHLYKKACLLLLLRLRDLKKDGR